MGKIYTESNTSSTLTSKEKPKPEAIAFLLNFSKTLKFMPTKTIGKVEYLLN